ncbi:MAG: PfkB family carbohydrate kinase [Actinomycetaceae bacterium]|nr:PfkB family carbohydrate kinase [Actinomycetaceae bacterium]
MTHALFVGLTTLDVVHGLDHAPDPTRKTTSTDHVMCAGGPATNAAVTFAALDRVAARLSAENPAAAAAEAAPSPDPTNAVSLLTAVGTSAIADLIRADLGACGLEILDACAPVANNAPEQAPAVCSIIEHPTGRMVASTNARLDTDADLARRLLMQAVATHGEPDIILVDGHNPALANEALKWGIDAQTDQQGSDDPFVELTAKPPHLRVLDGGSWKPWFTPLLGFIDIAAVSADFCPPLLTEPAPDAVAEFLKGFGITRIIRTDGEGPVRWWWDGGEGEVPVHAVNAFSTMGAGDIFHGALCWALARRTSDARTLTDPSEVIAFAAAIATQSTTTFGTRVWREDPEIARIIAG